MSDNYTDVILEDINSKFDAVLEVVAAMQSDMSTLAKASELSEVKADVKIVKAAVTDLSNHVNQQDTAIRKLQTN